MITLQQDYHFFCIIIVFGGQTINYTDSWYAAIM